MEDLMTYRVRIGTFSGVAALPAVLKRSRSMIRKLKRRRRPIKDLHLKSFLWLGSILLFVCVCASSYSTPAGYTGQNDTPDITSTARGVGCAGSVNHYQNFSFCPALSFQTTTLNGGCGHLNKNHTLPDSSLLHIPIMARLTHMDSTSVPAVFGRTYLEPSLRHTTTAGSGTCDFLLGNRGSHAYNGNPRTGKRRNERVSVAGPSRGEEEDIQLLHCEMVNKLSDLAYPEMGHHWKKLKNMLKVYFSQKDICDADDIFTVCETLEKKEIIKPGQYEVLTKLFTGANLMQCCEIVKEYSQKIEEVRRQPISLCAAKTVYSRDTPETVYSRDTAASSQNKMPSGEAVLRPNVLNVIREGVDVSVGFVRVRCSSGTGFRVGQDKFMTAYHVLRDEIDNLVQEILFRLEIHSEETVRDLISRLNVPIQRNNEEPFNETLERAVMQFIDDSATNIPLLILKLEGFTDTEALSQHLTTRWKENCTVDFVNHGKFSIDWRIQFGEKNRDIVIVKLLETQTGQDFPGALLLDGNYRQHGNIHVVRYVNQANQPQVVVDQATQVLQNDEEAQRQVTEAVKWWKDNLPDEDEDYFRRAYADCCTAVNDDTGRVILRASESFTPGSSGSPVVYLFNLDHLPVVALIYQGGYPEFYYNAQERFRQLQVDSKCFFERGTTMKNVAELLTGYGKTDLKEEIFRQPAAPREGEETRRLHEVVDALARHAYATGFGAAKTVYSWDTAASSHNKMPSVDMEATVKVWRNNDKLCYETKGIKDVVQKICSEEHICVVGEPGCGKSTAIRHAALYLKDKLGFIIYPVSGPKQFIDYLDRDTPQLFIFDDFCGEYFIDQDKLKAWGEYSEKIKDCLQVHKNTKVLFSLRVQLHSELKSKGITHIYNDQRHVINFSDKEYKLSRDTMQDMLRHYLQVHHVQNIEGLIRDVWWGRAEQFAGCFPLLCKVFSEDESVRVDPEKYFSDPWPALQNIFKRIKSDNKHQFCGLLLCGVTDLKDEYFSTSYKQNKPQQFDSLIESQNLDPRKDLSDIKSALQALDGVYISHIGNRYTFLHSIFQNIVTYLYDDKYYVFKYATLDFIYTRVRLFSKFDTDDDYVKVFYGDDCVELLVDRMIEELRSDDRDRWGMGARFIVKFHYIDNKELITCLMEKLFDSKHTQITQNKIDQLFGECLLTVCLYTPSPPHTDVTSCPQYQLLLSLIARCDCNKQIGVVWEYPLLLSVHCGALPVTKVLVEHQADVNVVDRHKRCVLHRAVECDNNVDITKYLLSLPNLKCLNHRDKYGHTPYWYVVNNKSPTWSWSVVRHRDELMKLYKHTAAIL